MTPEPRCYHCLDRPTIGWTNMGGRRVDYCPLHIPRHIPAFQALAFTKMLAGTKRRLSRR